jgi:hypothetical protein
MRCRNFALHYSLMSVLEMMRINSPCGGYAEKRNTEETLNEE